MKYPNVWKLHDLFTYLARGECASSNDGTHWVPARPCGFASIGARLRATKLVFTGKADAVIWDQSQ